jgi:hypothetical protein
MSKFVGESPSDLAITIVATPLPIKLVKARASDMNLSTPSNKTIPSTGIVCRLDKVAAKTINPPPVTAAAP